MKRALLALTALTLAGSGGPAPEPARAEGEKLCRIYCEVMYLGCLATGGRLDSKLCDEWYQGCKDGCKADIKPH